MRATITAATRGPNDTAWGRPAGVAVTREGALLVSDDANATIFRVTRK